MDPGSCIRIREADPDQESFVWIREALSGSGHWIRIREAGCGSENLNLDPGSWIRIRETGYGSGLHTTPICMTGQNNFEFPPPCVRYIKCYVMGFMLLDLIKNSVGGAKYCFRETYKIYELPGLYSFFCLG